MEARHLSDEHLQEIASKLDFPSKDFNVVNVIPLKLADEIRNHTIHPPLDCSSLIDQSTHSLRKGLLKFLSFVNSFTPFLFPGLVYNSRKKDFATIPENDWKLLVDTYGGGPTIYGWNVRVGPLTQFYTSLNKEDHQKTEQTALAVTTSAKEVVIMTSNASNQPLSNHFWAPPTYRYQQQSYVPGEVGLQNLGCTCYMNASLQCMSHLPLLTQYFLSCSFFGDVNLVSKFSHRGVIATGYWRLLQQLWLHPPNDYVSPTLFKGLISRLHKAFAGYGEQDAQEFLTFTIDALV